MTNFKTNQWTRQGEIGQSLALNKLIRILGEKKKNKAEMYR